MSASYEGGFFFIHASKPKTPYLTVFCRSPSRSRSRSRLRSTMTFISHSFIIFNHINAITSEYQLRRLLRVILTPFSPSTAFLLDFPILPRLTIYHIPA
ncbi:hypothetical protein M378DRAFT_751632 [Amanita muscaria Koide BX008]|uniref:Uncharacterized protein n=1 Tax=Amanita muscaria (strain Koide BX008) TaxID=946122 RepID=A0A0C2WM36_AMAMK|nr:hypothetical protein M378DRAFT_751632 [Amanita muscaria Koide BX008]